MKILWNVTDTLSDAFKELAIRIEKLMSDQARIWLLWFVVGVLLIGNIADNQTAVQEVWNLTTAREAGTDLFWLWKLIGSFVLSMLFIVCEGNLIMGFRDPEDAQPRFDDANAYRARKPSEDAPESAQFYYSALMNGELFDIRLSKAIGIVVFLLDCFIQYHNRTWNPGDNGQMLVSLGHAALMLVGTELVMVMIRVMRRRNYSTDQRTVKHQYQQPKQSKQAKKQATAQTYAIPDGQGGYTTVDINGQPV